jgi:hypothetical protein
MKKRILLVVMVFAIGVSSVLANTVNGVNEKVLSSFQKEFAGAKDVYWQKGNDFLKVSFTLDGKVLFAYYNESGEKLALVRNITSFDLPLGLQMELKQQYPQYWITDLFDFNGQEDSAYYITIENADTKITLKSVGLNGWTLYKRTQK